MFYTRPLIFQKYRSTVNVKITNELEKTNDLRVEFVTQHIIWQKNHKTIFLKSAHIKLFIELGNLHKNLYIHFLVLEFLNSVVGSSTC